MSRDFSRISLPADLSRFDEVIDVRSRLEYREDHLKGAVHLPVLDDRERAEIGTIFTQDSPFEARKQGAALISRNIAGHLEGHFAGKPKDYSALLYCWRGGQRSGSLATVLREVGWDVAVIEGGYKAYRQVVTETFERLGPELPLVMLNGYTGAGKTLVIRELARQGAQVIDLEGLARHKGSVFGGDPEIPQPAQKRFESLLYDALQEIDLSQPLFLEAESAKIGRLNIPNPIWQRMKISPVIEIDVPLDARADYLCRDYEDWVEDPDRVLATLDLLRRFQSGETMDRWRDLAGEQRWRDLIRDLLELHYDVKYTVDGSGHFEKPSAAVPLLQHDEDSIAACARAVIATAEQLLPASTPT